MQRNHLLPLLFCALIACSSDGGDDTSVQHEVATASGGVVASADQKLQVQIPAASFVEETATVSITTADGATTIPTPAAALGPAYVVEATGTPTATFSATLTFQVDAAQVQAIGGPQALGVAHGQIAGQAWDEILTGTYDAVNGVYTVVTRSFSYFALVNVNQTGTSTSVPGSDDAGQGLQDAAAAQDTGVTAVCTVGQTQACTCTSTGTASTRACVEGQWGECDCTAATVCTEGQTQDCTCADSDTTGTQSCTGGEWAACECQTATADPCEGLCQTGEYCDNGECVFGDSCGSDADCTEEGFCCNVEFCVCVPVDSADAETYCNPQ